MEGFTLTEAVRKSYPDQTAEASALHRSLRLLVQQAIGRLRRHPRQMFQSGQGDSA